MQNKGAIRLLAILFALVSIYQLSFTFFTSRAETKAIDYSERPDLLARAKAIASETGQAENYVLDSLKKDAQNFYLDSIAGEGMFFGYTYKDCKDRELNLGLDLKGGMNVTLEVAVQDIVVAMAGSNKTNPGFKLAIKKALEQQKNSQEDFITLFADAFKTTNPNVRLASIFSTVDLKEKINPSTTDEDVIKVLREQADAAIGNVFDILNKRIDKFGVTQPRIQKLQTAGRILVELPGVKDPKRVRKLLQSSAKLEFWETYAFKNPQIYNSVIKADEIIAQKYGSLKDIKAKSEEVDTTLLESTDAVAVADTAKAKEEVAPVANKDTALGGLNLEKQDTTKKAKSGTIKLFDYFSPNFVKNEQGYYPGNGPVVGSAMIHDTAKVMAMFRLPEVASLFPKNVKFLWGVKPPRYADGKNILELFAIKVTNMRDGIPPLDGEAITDARQDYDQNGQVEVNMTMDSQGALKWKNLTGDNIGEAIAIVLDDYVYSAPNVNSKIEGGRSQITGGFDIKEAEDLANVLKSGKLPVPARIIEEAIVGPSLGEEAINSGLISFVIAFILVLIYMFIFYNKAGLIADVALVVNIFFIFGVLSSLQAVLTLPGIAGIVLTLGMAVDANVIIYERIKEEIAAGKGFRLAISDGYKHAYSAIIDGNVTTILTAIVLYIFGSGPVQGFATTLIIGILTSLFSAIFISRLIIEFFLDKNKTISFDHSFSKNFLKNVKFPFIDKRRIAYTISITVTVLGIISLVVRGLNPGVDFSGGRTYVVRFDKDVNTTEIAASLKNQFKYEDGTTVLPEVKTFGPNSQVKIITKFMIDDKNIATDSIVEKRVYEGVKGYYTSKIEEDKFFANDEEKTIGLLSSQKVDPTISDDLLWASFLSVFAALLAIFAYIALRFKNWQMGLGGVVSLFHDAFFVISLYSIFYGFLPFDLEVDQAFIAAILTIIGYSINDTVIIFDRVREYRGLYPKMSLKDNMNAAFASTLPRTINTAGTTLVVLIAIFIFGGEVIRGFSFALMMGVIVGTYSSIFVASPVAYEFMKNEDQKRMDKK